jgi:hypothetical protein
MDQPKLPSDRAIGVLFATVSAGAAFWQWYVAGWGLWSQVWIGLCFVVLLVTIVWPRMLTPVNRAWMRLGDLLHRIVSPVVLGVMYAVLIVPVGLFMRLFGRDALRLKSSPESPSYWLAREESAFSPERFKNQF